MDCDLARRLLPFARPGGADLDPADRAALDRHLASCPGCAAAGAADRAFDAGLARAMRAIPVPAGLGLRLHARLAAARMAFYRRLVAYVLIAICALIAGCFAWAVCSRPVLDPSQLAQQTYELSGQSRADADARQAATDWLRQADARLRAPDEFNYGLLSYATLSDLRGLAGVPTLVFARGGATLRVYAVREHAFKDLGGFREGVEVGGCTVEARRYEAMPGWVFVVVTSGAPPDDFRKAGRPLDPA